MSSSTWTTTAVASEARAISALAWRAVEAQHRVSTMALVDSLAEQEQLEALLESSKPPIPAMALGLHWLLFTPFRYPTSRHGSRFRRPYDPGVLYAAELQRTACAELGYWRWRFVTESPALVAIDTLPQTLFQVALKCSAVDLRAAPFATEAERSLDPLHHDYCQAFGALTREAGVDAIVYQSVRDQGLGACVAVLTPTAFAKKEPLNPETWHLTVTLKHVVWQKSDVLSRTAFEFDTAAWRN